MDDEEQMSASELLKELAEVVTMWHEQKTELCQEILEGAKKDKMTIKHPGGEITFEGDRLKGLRAGMQIAMEIFEKLPFKLEENADPDDDDDVALPVKSIVVEEIPKPEGYGTFS
jgi:hypothetical protein